MSVSPTPVPVLDPRIAAVFGHDDDPMPRVEARAREAFPGRRLIVWEGDAQTFAFSYVGGDAEELLGHPAQRWVDEASFWADHVVHPDDRDDAIAYCALATGRGTDHHFEYRAVDVDGSLVWLEDHVRVVLGARGIPVRLRGLMFDVTDEKRAAGKLDSVPDAYVPARPSLAAQR